MMFQKTLLSAILLTLCLSLAAPAFARENNASEQPSWSSQFDWAGLLEGWSAGQNDGAENRFSQWSSNWSWGQDAENAFSDWRSNWGEGSFSDWASRRSEGAGDSLSQWNMPSMSGWKDSYTAPQGFTASRYTVESYEGSIDLFCIEPDALVGKTDVPVILYTHGGAFYIPLMSNMVDKMAYYADALQARVFIPDYRSSLSDPFPVPMLDCYYSALFLEENAARLGIDMNNALIYGDSAGGALAAAVTQCVRDFGGPEFRGQLLIYPVTDNSLDHPSIEEFKDSSSWSAASNAQMWEIYLKNGDDGQLKYAAPLQSDDFTRLPRAYVEPAENDVLRDEGIAYAQALQSAGIEVELNISQGTRHAFDSDHSDPYVQSIMAHRVEVMRDMLTNR